MSITVKCDCGKVLRVKTEHAGKRVRCPACGGITPVPATPAEAPASSEDPFSDAEIPGFSKADSQQSTFPLQPQQTPPSFFHAGPQQTANAAFGGQPSPRKKTVGSGFAIDANVLKIVALLLIGIDIVMVGIWQFLGLVPLLKLIGSSPSMFFSWAFFSALLTFGTCAARMGLIVGAVGILRGEPFGKKFTNVSAGTLLALSAIGLIISLVTLMAAFKLSFILMFIWSGVTPIALSGGILFCVNHPKWED